MESLDIYCTATRSVDRALVVKLRDTVVRQMSFSEKMAGLLWIRSPTLADTIRRVTERYARFLRLFRQFPGELPAPTLDIDLVWHTPVLARELLPRDAGTRRPLHQP